MAWVRLDDNFPSHPKVIQAGPVAAYLFVCGLCYCRKFHTGGFIPMKALGTLGLTARPKRMVDALVAIGLWEPADNGYRIHDYHEMYEDDADRATKIELRRLRREAGRRGGLARSEASKQNTDFASSKEGDGSESGSLSVLEEKKKRDDAFDFFWSIYPRSDGRKKAREFWDRINPDEDVQRKMWADIERRRRSTGWLKEGGQYIPMASTYLHGRRWEDGFKEQPRLSERTVNVLKGFEEPE